MFYYRVYDEAGVRLCGHSKGMTTKTEAQEYCLNIMREGKLLLFKKEKPVPTFGEFAQGRRDYDICPYLKKRKGQRKISKNSGTTSLQTSWYEPEYPVGSKYVNTLCYGHQPQELRPEPSRLIYTEKIGTPYEERRSSHE